MLTTLPNYEVCETLANEMIASLQKAFPALEARFTNDDVANPLNIEARNPLNGECWVGIGTVGPNPRNPANTEVLIGNLGRYENPVARFTGNPKKPIDSAIVCRTLTEYIKQVRAKQEKEIKDRQTVNASKDAATKLTKQIKKAGLPTEEGMPRLTIAERPAPTNHYYKHLPPDAILVHLSLNDCVVPPETAEQILKLWKPIGKLLAETPDTLRRKNECPAAGTLVN
ncbi:MAG: hypothetical protein U0X20_17200 [Caldilineaceae bacterium]